ncbi:MAG: Tol-Pal system beta propeller repeat protein TolB, partial [Alphaproteobacteria bacterium]
YIDKDVLFATYPAFPNWKLVGSQYLVTGAVSRGASGLLNVDFRLWDVNAGREISGVGAHFEASEESWRRIGHQISDKVYAQLTGEPGYFDTRIAFVSESGPKTQKRRVLALMDQDGANPQFPAGPDATAQVFTPRFSANGVEVVYMALRDSGSQLYLFNLDTNHTESLGRYEGTAFGPRFSPDGSKVAFAVARRGNSDIFVADVRSGGAPTQLTSDPNIDASPSFSPDGRQIVFNSDRAGSPQLYIMGADGAGARRLSSGSGRYTTPVWSPDPADQWIAFTKQTGSTFHIGIMRPDGSDERLLTESYLDEGPSWAPNGRLLIFSRESGPNSEPRLWTVDLTGRIIQPAAFSGPGSDPAWSTMPK